jgi:hypothetical protein
LGFSRNGTSASAAQVFNGVLDEVAVFNHALTPAQIQQLYDNGCQLPPVKAGCKKRARD